MRFYTSALVQVLLRLVQSLTPEEEGILQEEPGYIASIITLLPHTYRSIRLVETSDLQNYISLLSEAAPLIFLLVLSQAIRASFSRRIYKSTTIVVVAFGETSLFFLLARLTNFLWDSINFFLLNVEAIFW